jgi:hypothetical protein
VNGAASVIETAARRVLSRLQTGIAQTYALAMAAGAVAIIAYLALG